MRNTINLEESFGGLMSNPDVVAKMPTALHWLAFRVGGVVIPLGMILFFLFMCLAVWFFLWSKKGIAMSAAGENELFTQSNAINVNQMRILGTVLSTVLGAIGIIMYAQVFGFLQLYNAPLRGRSDRRRDDKAGDGDQRHCRCPSFPGNPDDLPAGNQKADAFGKYFVGGCPDHYFEWHHSLRAVENERREPD